MALVLFQKHGLQLINSTCEGLHVTNERFRAVFLFSYPDLNLDELERGSFYQFDRSDLSVTQTHW